MQRIARYLVCEHCDAVYARTTLLAGQSARCHRCGARVARRAWLNSNSLLALTLAALIVFAIANAYPIVTINAQGHVTSSTLWESVIATYNDGKWGVSVAAVATIFFAPLMRLTMLAYILLPLQRGRRARNFRAAMAVLRWLRPWGMIDVFILGALVAVVKIGGLASVAPGIGIFAFGALTILIAALNSVDNHDLWDIIEEAQV